MAESYSGLSRKRVAIPAYSIATVEFFDTQPNYFRVTNQGEGKLYFATTRTPNEKNYDFACDAKSLTMHSEPYPRKTLMINNPTGSEIEVDILSFFAPFDPLALAFSAIKLDFSATSLETSTSIDSFKTALPAGNNKIGLVEVTNPAPDYTSVLADILAALNTIAGKLADGEGVSY